MKGSKDVNAHKTFLRTGHPLKNCETREIKIYNTIHTKQNSPSDAYEDSLDNDPQNMRALLHKVSSRILTH